MSDDGGAVVDPAQGADAPSGGFRKGAFGVSGSGDTSGFGGLVRVEPVRNALRPAAESGMPNPNDFGRRRLFIFIHLHSPTNSLFRN